MLLVASPGALRLGREIQRALDTTPELVDDEEAPHRVGVALVVVPSDVVDAAPVVARLHALGMPTLVARTDKWTPELAFALGQAGAHAIWDGREETLGRLVHEHVLAEPASGVHRANERFLRLLRSIPAAVWQMDLQVACDQLAADPLDAPERAISVAAESVRLLPLNDEAAGVGRLATPVIAGAVLRSWVGGDREVHVEVGIEGDEPKVLLLSAIVPGPAARSDVVLVGLDVSRHRELERTLLAAQRLEAVGRLASGVAHDFNNVLTILGNYTDFLAEELPDGSATRRDVLVMRGTIERASGMVSQLLTLGRRRAPKLDRIELNEVLFTTKRLLQRTLGANIEIDVALYHDDLYVDADRAQLDQVIMNLAMNARDAMPGGGRLAIHTFARRCAKSTLTGGYRVPSGDYVVMTVRDSGAGMSAATVERIFEPFFSTKAERGSGLGLATTYSIIKQHGGFINVRSVVDEGSEFEIMLPRQHQSPTIDVKQPARYSTPPAQGMRVLIVEDDPEVLGTLGRILEARGLKVCATTDPDEALRVAEDPRVAIDLVISDVMMPRVDGVALTSRLQRLRPNLAVVLMSGHTEHEALTKLMSGKAVFMRKPFSMTDVYAAIGEALGRIGEREQT